jgi:hypothetical protein
LRERVTSTPQINTSWSNNNPCLTSSLTTTPLPITMLLGPN